MREVAGKINLANNINRISDILHYGSTVAMENVYGSARANYARRILGGCKICFEMKTDKGQFDEVLRRMLQKPPQKTSEIKAPKKPSKPSQK